MTNRPKCDNSRRETFRHLREPGGQQTHSDAPGAHPAHPAGCANHLSAVVRFEPTAQSAGTGKACAHSHAAESAAAALGSRTGAATLTPTTVAAARGTPSILYTLCVSLSVRVRLCAVCTGCTLYGTVCEYRLRVKMKAERIALTEKVYTQGRDTVNSPLQSFAQPFILADTKIRT